MNWFSKIFSTKESDKKEATVKEKDHHENKQDGVVLEGLGSSKKVIQDVYQEQRELLFVWRERYSQEEYPYKVVLNII